MTTIEFTLDQNNLVSVSDLVDQSSSFADGVSTFVNFFLSTLKASLILPLLSSNNATASSLPCRSHILRMTSA